MDLPTFLPSKLQFASSAERDKELFNLLLKNTGDLVQFFTYASDDETWSENHKDFMKLALGWFTNQHFQDKLASEYAEAVKESIYRHHSILKPLIPYNITLKIEGVAYPANSLLLGSNSIYLRNLLIRECLERNQKTLSLSGIKTSEAIYLLNYLHTGRFGELWKWTQDEILSLLVVVEKLRLPALSKESQTILKRYLSRENVIDTLIKAQRQHHYFLKEACVDFFNNLEYGAKLKAIDFDHLGFEFLNYLDKTWSFFTTLVPLITHLIVSGKLVDDPHFFQALNLCPNLMGLDISGSESVYLLEAPARIQELKLARTSWIDDDNFKTILSFFPQITSLSLSQNTQLSYNAFADLKKLPELKTLDISRCQIGDDELSLISQSCPLLIDLDLSGLKKITEKGFLDLIQSKPKLMHLKASRTVLNDRVLFELSNRCRSLETLDLSHCVNVTEKGVAGLLKNALSLKYLILPDHLPQDRIAAIQKAYPKLFLKY